MKQWHVRKNWLRGLEATYAERGSVAHCKKRK